MWMAQNAWDKPAWIVAHNGWVTNKRAKISDFNPLRRGCGNDDVARAKRAERYKAKMRAILPAKLSEPEKLAAYEAWKAKQAKTGRRK